MSPLGEWTCFVLWIVFVLILGVLFGLGLEWWQGNVRTEHWFALASAFAS